MMRIEVASNPQIVYGERRAEAAVRPERGHSANAQPAAANATRDGTLHVEATTSEEKASRIGNTTAPGEGVGGNEQQTDQGAQVSLKWKDVVWSEEDLKEIVETLSKLNQFSKNKIEFTFDPEKEISVIRVVDGETGEVIREIPPDKLLAAMGHVFDLLGIVFDQTA